MSDNTNTNVESEYAAENVEQTRALIASGAFPASIAAALLEGLRKLEQRGSDTPLDEWGNVKVGQSTLTVPAILAVLEAEASDKPLSVRLAAHLQGMTDATSSCTDLRNNPPRRTVVGKGGEAIGTPISMRSSSFQYRGLTLGGSLKAADTNAGRLKKLAALHDKPQSEEVGGQGENGQSETVAGLADLGELAEVTESAE